jgi:hypothetical protein
LLEDRTLLDGGLRDPLLPDLPDDGRDEDFWVNTDVANDILYGEPNLQYAPQYGQNYDPLGAGQGNPPPGGPPVGPGISGNVLVNDPNEDHTAQDTQSETTMLVFGNTIVSGFNDSGSFLGGASKFTGYSISTDGGKTFKDMGVLPTNPNGDVGDPSLARDNTTGRIYFATLQFSGSGLDVFRSDDNGNTWKAPVQGAPGKSGFQDKEWITVDNNAGAGRGNVYLVNRDFGGGNGIYFYRSTNGGDSFGPNGGTLIAPGNQGAWVTVGSDHAVYVFYLDSNTSTQRVQMRKSTDQGLTFAPAVTVANLNTHGVNGDLGLGFRSNAFAQALVNPTNPNQIFTVFDDKPTPTGPDRADVYLEVSNDGGATWSARQRVNDDATNTDQWQPTIAIAPNGSRIGVFWYDRRLDVTNNRFIDYYGSIATVSPTGVTFQPNFRITDTSFAPVFGVDPVVNGVYMGDYDQAQADNSAFYVTWGDNRDNSIAVPSRKNANVRFAKISVGMSVVSTTPADGDIVTTQPTDFVVTTSDPYRTTGILASALQVNGVSADSVALTNPTTLTFHYNVSPVVNQGLQTIHVSPGAIVRASDGDPIQDFTAHFRYAATRMTITTDPPSGSVIELPFTQPLRVNLNVPVDPATVNVNNLKLNIGQVTGFTISADRKSIDYTLTGLNQEVTLTVDIAAGTYADDFGNPNLAFSGNYVLDFNTVPLPGALTSLAPLGSEIYASPAQAAFINPVGDVDSFTLDVAAGQAITVLVSRTSGNLQPSVQLTGPFSDFANAPPGNSFALLQTSGITPAGTYTFSVSGLNGTTGGYTIQVWLNARLAEDQYARPIHDSRANAEDLNKSFIPLADGASRGAVLGQTGVAGAKQDYYSFLVNAGDTITAALTTLGAGSPDVWLENAAGSVLAMGAAGPSNVGRAINNYVVPVSGTYYLRVSAPGVPGAKYSLVVTRNSSFDLLPNSDLFNGPVEYLSGKSSNGTQYALGYVGNSGNGNNVYAVTGLAGSTLTVQTLTPGGLPGQFSNNLDPNVNLYDPFGNLVASDDNSGADGRNASMSYVVPDGASGLYFVEVTPSTATATPTQGEYVLEVGGSTTVDLNPFQVSVITLADKGDVNTQVGSLRVTFSDNLLLTSLKTSALTVDGLPATGFAILDGKTVQFTLPALGAGHHLVSITSLLDVHGRLLTRYDGDFTIDRTAPRVIGSSIQENGVVFDGRSWSYTVQFDKPLDGVPLTALAWKLHGNLLNKDYAADSFTYIQDTSTLTLNYSNLPSDRYTLTLFSGPFHDLAGNNLDGEPHWPIPPNKSGDGVPGGNFFVDFTVHRPDGPFPTPLNALKPAGSLIYQGTANPAVIVPGLTDNYTLTVNPGQTITLLATPLDATLRPEVDLFDSSGNLVASAQASAAGKNALLQTVPVDADTYTLSVQGIGGTTGAYQLQTTLNTALEQEDFAGGGKHDTTGTAQDLEGSFIGLPNGASRGAILGKFTGTDVYSFHADAGQALTIGATLSNTNTSLFGPLTTFSTGTGFPGPIDAKYADLRGIGRQDMVVANYANSTVSVLLSNGDGTFAPAKVYSLGAGANQPYQVAIGDLRGIGRKDLVVSTISGGYISVLLGNGDGTFGAAKTYFLGGPFYGVAVGDLNGDGRDDVVVANYNSSAITVLLAQPDGTLGAPKNYTTGPGFQGTINVALGDLRGIGRKDVVVTNYQTASISVLFNNGDGTFGNPTNYGIGMAGFNPWGLTLADLRGTGRLDVVTADSSAGQVSVRLNNGDGTFGQLTTYSVGASGPVSVAAADVNGDGKLDLVTANRFSSNVSVLPGNGDGTFGKPLMYPMGSSAYSVALTDVNGDGLPDLTVADNNGNAVSVRLSTPPDRLELLDPTGKVVATGINANNLDRVISNFVAATSGTHYVRIAGGVPTDYNVVVTRGAAFDTESNDGFAAAQDLTGTGGSLGNVASGANLDALFNLRGTPVSGDLILKSPQLTIAINHDGSFIDSNSPPKTGIVFAGVEFVTPGTPLAGFTISRNGQNFTNAAAAFLGSAIAVTKEDISSGSFHGVRVVGTVGGNLLLERIVAFNDGDEFATIATRLTNISSTTLTGVASLENVDPDQGTFIGGGFATNNTIVLNKQMIRAHVIGTGFPGGLTIGLASADPRHVVGAGGFVITNPFDVINNPRDPGGALEDVTINMAYNYGSLAPGTSTSGATLLVLGRSTGDADNTYQTNANQTGLSDDDWYKVNATDGQTLVFQTSTPGDGGGEFRNLLDPHIELYSPAGVKIADGTVLDDGRNEQITFVVPAGAGGAYRIRVSAENGTKGEYFLSSSVQDPAPGGSGGGLGGFSPLTSAVLAQGSNSDLPTPSGLPTDAVFAANLPLPAAPSGTKPAGFTVPSPIAFDPQHVYPSPFESLAPVGHNGLSQSDALSSHGFATDALDSVFADVRGTEGTFADPLEGTVWRGARA